MLITFEGCEGCGKSTQARLLREYLDKTGQEYVFAREPGGTAVSEKIRAIILDKDNSDMSAECEALLYAASRAQLIKRVLLPELKRGKLVILDRYIDSSFAYQVFARGLPFEFVAKANGYAMQNCMPDVTVFLDVPPSQAFSRKGGIDENDRMELEGLEFHNKVYSGYRQLAQMYPDRFVSFEAKGTKYQTSGQIIEYFRNKGYIK